MIESFKDKETSKIWRQEFSKRIPEPIQKTAYRKLVMIHRSRDLNDLRIPPGNRLESLSGGRSGQHSVRINDQWRICFRWENGSVHNVEIVDYH
ncbi:MAG: type II toxin-antitoxin system RelE/ParE family toxin [Spirochaetaceae bacterium]|nr:MAG: type II toxin-antitoxin system RelE/ParE family toxin [Spirochaetaceae bacterium]